MHFDLHSRQSLSMSTSHLCISDDHGSVGRPQQSMELPSSDEELPPQSSPPQLSSVHPSSTSSHKCKHLTLASASESFRSSSFGPGLNRKKHCTSGISILGGIKESIDEFETIMCDGMPVGQIHAADRAAAYQVEAMEKVQTQKPDLNDDQVVALVDLFRTDLSVAEVYMVIVWPAIHQAWLNKPLKQLGFLDKTLPGVVQKMIE